LAQRRFSPVRSRRPMFWLGNSMQHTATTGAAVANALSSEADLENVPNATIVRVRGMLTAQITSTAAVPGRCLITCGIKVATASALAGGTLQQPFTDIGSDWLWWTSIPLSVLGGTVAAPDADGRLLTARIDIDSKAMRKTGLNDVLVFVTQNTVVTSTQTCDVLAGIRVLFKR